MTLPAVLLWLAGCPAPECVAGCERNPRTERCDCFFGGTFDTGDGFFEPLEDCGDGVDNDNDGRIDCEDGDCFDFGTCREGFCDDGVDNDNDGDRDCIDSDCWGTPDCDGVLLARVSGGDVTMTRSSSFHPSTSSGGELEVTRHRITGRNVQGTFVRLDVEGFTRCSWFAEDVDLRLTLSNIATASAVAYDGSFDTSRVGFTVDPGCNVQKGSVLGGPFVVRAGAARPVSLGMNPFRIESSGPIWYSGSLSDSTMSTVDGPPEVMTSSFQVDLERQGWRELD